MTENKCIKIIIISIFCFFLLGCYIGHINKERMHRYEMGKIQNENEYLMDKNRVLQLQLDFFKKEGI